jgi:hypothetical protein
VASGILFSRVAEENVREWDSFEKLWSVGEMRHGFSAYLRYWCGGGAEDGKETLESVALV